MTLHIKIQIHHTYVHVYTVYNHTFTLKFWRWAGICHASLSWSRNLQNSLMSFRLLWHWGHWYSLQRVRTSDIHFTQTGSAVLKGLLKAYNPAHALSTLDSKQHYYCIGPFFWGNRISCICWKNVFADLNFTRIAYLVRPLTIPTMQFTVFIFEDDPKILFPSKKWPIESSTDHIHVRMCNNYDNEFWYLNGFTYMYMYVHVCTLFIQTASRVVLVKRDCIFIKERGKCTFFYRVHLILAINSCIHCFLAEQVWKKSPGIYMYMCQREIVLYPADEGQKSPKQLSRVCTFFL